MIKPIPLPENGKYDNLDALFEVWKEVHRNDASWEKTFPKCPVSKMIPKEQFKGSFTYDGSLSEKTECDVLFIGRESNVSKKIDSLGETENVFWMKEVWHSEKNGGNYRNYLTEIMEKLEADSCAYMNINKRGGYSACTYARLNNYVDVYREFIKKEIELIKPKKVVFLGAGHYAYIKKVKQIVQEVNQDIACYEVYHPSAWNKYQTLNDKLKGKF